MDENQSSLKFFLEVLAKPEDLAASLLWKRIDDATVNSLDATLVYACKILFERNELLGSIYSSVIGTKQNETDPIVLSGLEALYTGVSTTNNNINDDDSITTPVDSESLWGQVDLQNEALLSLLKKSIKKLSKSISNDNGKESLGIRLLDEVTDTDSESGMSKNSENQNDNEENDNGSDHDDSESDDSADRRIKSRMDRVMTEMEEYHSDEASIEGSSKNVPKSPSSRQVDDESELDPAAEELNDGFFSVHEMEAFADEEEEYLPDEAYGPVKPENKNEKNDQRTFHQKQRDGDIDVSDSEEESDEEEDDLLFRNGETDRRRRYRDDDEVDALLGMYKKPNNNAFNDDDDDSIDDIINMTAADIFGKPNKKRLESWKSKEKTGKKNDVDNSWNDDRFDNEAETVTQIIDKNETEESNTLMIQEHSDEDVPMKGRAGPAKRKDKKAPTKQVEKIVQQTEELEKEILAEKPWQMIGEAASTARPVNSLLESTPEFEIATKIAPIITVEYTASLEDIIKKRILNEDWDDVIPRELPDVGWYKRKGELPEVSQEKSKLGLGELYEREYLKKVAGYDVDKAEKETEEEKAKNEMKTLFANLCSKLDALSNYHFAPRPIADEAEIKLVSQPAIAMEEVLPLHVSNARGAAPEEVYATKRGRDGILRADSELDQPNRKRLRRAKKAARRKARKEKQADEKLISRLQPGLGLNNPYEKRKVREELSVARAGGKVVTGKQDNLGNSYGASGTFFQRMQAAAEQSMKSQQKLIAADQTNEAKSSSKSSALKL